MFWEKGGGRKAQPGAEEQGQGRAGGGNMFSNYDSVLKIDGEVGNKKMYDPRSWGREAESAMAARVVEACRQLGSAGKALK